MFSMTSMLLLTACGNLENTSEVRTSSDPNTTVETSAPIKTPVSDEQKSFTPATTSDSPSKTASGTTVNSVSTGSEDTPKNNRFTLSDIAKHNTAEDCLMVIRGKVYDVTNSINSHPGGDSILEGCGKDATFLFENPEGRGKGHSRRAEAMLNNDYIGELTPAS